MYVSVLYIKIPQRFAERTFLSPWLQRQPAYTVACVCRWPGLCLGLWPCFYVFAVSVLCRFFSPDILELWLSLCLHTGRILPLTRVSYLGHSWASFSPHLCSEKDLYESLSAYICPSILPSSGGWYWWDLPWLSWSSHPQSCWITFVNFLTGTTFLVSLCSVQSAMTSLG